MRNSKANIKKNNLKLDNCLRQSTIDSTMEHLSICENDFRRNMAGDDLESSPLLTVKMTFKIIGHEHCREIKTC